MTAVETRASLLLRIRDLGDSRAWSEFVRLYMPLIYCYAIRNGLQDADAADVAQATLCQVARNADVFTYDRSKGSFRGWLLTIARNQIRKSMQRNHRERNALGPRVDVNAVEDDAIHGNDEELWNRDYQVHMFQWAMERVRGEFQEKTWQAFLKTMVEQQPVYSVASDLGMSAGSIYVARSRVVARIRTVIAEIDGTWS